MPKVPERNQNNGEMARYYVSKTKGKKRNKNTLRKR